MNKVVSLQQAGEMVRDNALLAVGGNVLHRAPMAMMRELVRQQKKGLSIIKTTGAHDVDVLCAGGCVDTVNAGFIGYESEYGLAMYYRRGVEEGRIRYNEHSCYTVMSALRAAAYGAPFLPVSGLNDNDLIRYNDHFRVIDDPFGGGKIAIVKALKPDYAILHVHECDQRGNARIFGPEYDDVLMALAADRIILTTEEIVSETRSKMNAEEIDIPYFLVDAVVHAPGGALPCSCYKKYEPDHRALHDFKAIKMDDGIKQYLNRYEKKDRIGKAGSRI